MTSYSQDNGILVSIKLLVAALPFLVMLHAHLVNGALFLLASVSVYALARNNFSLFSTLKHDFPYLKIALAAFFVAPITAVFLGQFFRGEFSWPNYDSPSRILLCLPIFILLYHLRIDAVKYLRFSLPGALFFTVLLVHLGPTIKRGDGRLSVYSVDLLTFSSLSLTFGLLCLVSIGVLSPFRSKASLILFLGFLSGIYLSVSSGSRTGWLALPIVITLWGIHCFGKKYTMLFVVLMLLFSGMAVSYVTVQPVKERIDQAVYDLETYRWEGPNVETSLGARISFYRIGFSLFMQRPLSGWGDRSFADNINKLELYQFASLSTREGLIRCGFHNEIMTNCVRSGIWGALSSLILFFVPTVVFSKALFMQRGHVSAYGLWGLSYLLCLLVSAMSTEVFNLKYTASFHALMLSFLMATTLSEMRTAKCTNE